MDKFEYKVRSEEITALVEEQNYREAAEIADTIDWRRVKSVRMLCTISDVYKMVRRYEDSRALLLLAYEKRPSSRMIVYALTELCLKLGDIVNAWEYYKEFCKIAPTDTRRYILLYKVYVAQEVSLDEQIKVLEKLKEEEYTDRWAYELAYLYHRIGFATKCVEECDEMILWFGEGKFVRKAMELKMLHEPLTPKQQAMYNGEVANEVENGHTKVIPNLNAAITKEVTDLDPSTAPTIQFPAADVEEIQVKTMDDSPYNTINLQKALAESMAELMGKEEQPIWQNAEQAPGEDYISQDQADYDAEYDMDVEESEEESQDVQLAELDETEDPILRHLMAPMLEETQEMPPIPDQEEIFFDDPNTQDMSVAAKELSKHADMTEIILPPASGETDSTPKEEAEEDSEPQKEDGPREKAREEEIQKEAEQKESGKEEKKPQGPTYERESTETGVKKVIVPTNPDSIFKIPDQPDNPDNRMKPSDFATQKSSFDHILSQESDGQISLVIPERIQLEKQITGQMNIQDILREWEDWKKKKEEQLKQDVKKRVLDQTGELFAEFDEAAKEGLLEQLQNASIAAEAAERRKAEESFSEDEYGYEPEEDETVEEDIEEAAEDEVIEENIEETVGDVAEKASEAEEAEIEESETEADLSGNDSEAEMESSKDAATSESPEPENTVSAPHERSLSPEEKELFGSFVQGKKAKDQLLSMLDNMSLAAYTGNVLITGDKDAGALSFAKNLIKNLQATDGNFSGKAAKITGSALNKKNPADIIDKLKNGALIIDAAGGMNCSTAEALVKALQSENKGILVLLVDTKTSMNGLMEVNEVLHDPFNTRFDIEALNDDALVAFGKKYAYEREYGIDEMGILALHTRIAEMQTMSHAVTVTDVKELVKEAIWHANRKTPKHFFDILVGKRYDKEDMIILRENDFLV